MCPVPPASDYVHGERGKATTVRGKIAMGRKKVPMGLIPRPRLRANTFGKRKEGLKKKANELSVLCGVEVALVVAPPAAVDGDGGGAGAAAAKQADVWESKEGVLARYRELDPEVRARHTFREYLYAELGKEEAKLARVRQAGPDGLGCWDKALDGVDTVEEAQKLLDAIDAAIRAADDRRRALGMPVDDDDNEDGGGGARTVLDGIAPLGSAAVGDDSYLLNALAGTGNGNATTDQAMAVWDNNNGFHHPCGAANMSFQQFNVGNGGAMESYDLQMVPGMFHNGGYLATDAYHHYQTPRDAGAMQHGYGFPCARASASYFGMPSSGYQMQQVVGGGAAAQPILAAMSSTDEPCHGMVPVPAEYPTGDTGLNLNYMDTQATHGGVHGSGGTSFAMDARGNFVSAPPAAFSVAMSTAGGGGGGGDFISGAPPPVAPSQTMGGTRNDFTRAQPLAMSYGGDMAVAGRYATQSGMEMEQLHFLGDLEDTQTQPNPWAN